MKKVVLIAVILLSAKVGFTQSDPDPITGCWPPPCVPIDGGISFLLIAGAAYGGKKIYDAKKNKISNIDEQE